MAFSLRRVYATTLRPLRAEHADDCATLHAAAFAHPWSAQEFAALLTSPSALGVAALEPTTRALRGFVLSRVAADEAEILTIAVDPAWRKHGVGRDLLREHIDQLALAGVKAIFLEVDPDNAPAIALYSHRHFVKVGERPGYYKRADGKTASALLMRRDLA